MTPVPKQALKDPRGWVVESLASVTGTSRVRDAALAAAESLVPLSARLQELEVRRGRRSREIGRAKSSGADAAPLIATMRTLVEEARAVENELRASLQGIADRIDAASSSGGAEGSDRDDAAGCPAYLGVLAKEAVATREGLAVAPLAGTADERDYTAYVRAHPARTAYHALGLRELIEDANGQRCHHLLARAANDGTVRGVLPLVHLKSSLFGDFMVSMPWFNYGGPLADDDVASETLMQAASDLAREHGCSHAEIRETSPRAGWTARTDKVSMTLALPDTVERLDKSLGSSLRAQSNKAVKAGCTFRVGGRELLDDFYRVFCINMRDLGTPVQGRDFFEGLLELFGDDAFLSVVSRDGRPLAAGFLLAHGGETLEIPWASSLRRANPLGVNMLLYRRTLGEAVARGYRHFDFGRSTVGESTWRFKKQWGAVQRQLYWHYWTRDGDDMTGPSADSPKFRLAIAAWRRLPVALTRRLGPPLVRGLP